MIARSVRATLLGAVSHWRQHRMWLLGAESVASLAWVVSMALALALAIAAELADTPPWGVFGLGLTWGVALAVVATVQLIAALALGFPYDRWDLRAFSVAAIFPLLYWTIAAAAALRSQVVALARGPRERRVVWDIPREGQQAS